MASNNVVKLAQRIKDEFGIKVDPESYVTTHAGNIHLKAGCPVWFFNKIASTKVDLVCGFGPMRDYLVQRNRLEGELYFFERSRILGIEVYKPLRTCKSQK